MDRSLRFGCGGFVVVVRSPQVNCCYLVASSLLRVGCCESMAVNWLHWVCRCRFVAVNLLFFVYVIVGRSLRFGCYESVARQLLWVSLCAKRQAEVCAAFKLGGIVSVGNPDLQ